MLQPLIQKLSLKEGTSFVAKTFHMPHFEVGWRHIRTEQILLVCIYIKSFYKCFKCSTKRARINFLNEMRINLAGDLLTATARRDVDICWVCGYHIPANLHKQFLKISYNTGSHLPLETTVRVQTLG